MLWNQTKTTQKTTPKKGKGKTDTHHQPNLCPPSPENNPDQNHFLHRKTRRLDQIIPYQNKKPHRIFQTKSVLSEKNQTFYQKCNGLQNSITAYLNGISL